MRVWIGLGVLVMVGCGDPMEPDAGREAQDASALDASGSVDSGSVDSGLADSGSIDGGSVADGSIDSGSIDADVLDGGSQDGGPLECNADAIRFAGIARGPFAVGTLCDDVVVCVADADEVARVMAASSAFRCGVEAHSACARMTCTYRDPGGPSTLDEADLAHICAVSLVSPTPDLVCVVYA